jgi:hypothetical protein
MLPFLFKAERDAAAKKWQSAVFYTTCLINTKLFSTIPAILILSKPI